MNKQKQNPFNDKTKELITNKLEKISDEWFIEFVRAVDRHSYACRGIFTCIDGKESTEKIALELRNLTIEELKNHCL